MPKYLAFLRAINVGGHIVKMDHLRRLFEELEFENVETFIASGNVIFDSRSKNTQALEKKIETHLKNQLGYEVTTFVRSVAGLAAIAEHPAFANVELKPKEGKVYIGFLAKEPGKKAHEALRLLRNEFDDFQINGRELYWLCQTKFSECEISGPVLAKALGMQTTLRNVNTVRRLAKKYC